MNMIYGLLVLAGVLTLSQPAPSQSRVVHLDNSLGNSTSNAFDIRVLYKKKPGWITLIIDSQGGHLDAADDIIQAIYEAEAHGSPVHCRVTDRAFSAAFYIFAHCRHRSAAWKARFMWHEVKFYRPGTHTWQWWDRELENMRQLEKGYLTRLRVRTGWSKDRLMYLRNNSIYMTLDQLRYWTPKWFNKLGGFKWKVKKAGQPKAKKKATPATR